MMTKCNPVLMESGENQLDKTVVVPEMLTEELWRAAASAKIHDTNLTLIDWLEGVTKKDCEDVGIPWPEMIYDRQYEINQSLQELLIRTMWNAIINRVKNKI